MFCWMPNSLQSSRVNFEANRGSRSLMIFMGRPYLVNTCLAYRAAVSSPDISSTHGMKMVAFEQSWFVTVSMESYPCDTGSLVMKSTATVSKGVASGLAQIGSNVALVRLVVDFMSLAFGASLHVVCYFSA
jgi:hypothetical protein